MFQSLPFGLYARLSWWLCSVTTKAVSVRRSRDLRVILLRFLIAFWCSPVKLAHVECFDFIWYVYFSWAFVESKWPSHQRTVHPAVQCQMPTMHIDYFILSFYTSYLLDATEGLDAYLHH